VVDETTFLLGNARAESGAVDGEEKQAMGDRGGYAFVSSLWLSRFPSLVFVP
jgi:hypothetical protein